MAERGAKHSSPDSLALLFPTVEGEIEAHGLLHGSPSCLTSVISFPGLIPFNTVECVMDKTVLGGQTACLFMALKGLGSLQRFASSLIQIEKNKGNCPGLRSLMFIPTSLLTRLFPPQANHRDSRCPQKTPRERCLTDLRARPAIPKRGTLILEGLNPKGDPLCPLFPNPRGESGRHLRNCLN